MYSQFRGENIKDASASIFPCLLGLPSVEILISRVLDLRGDLGKRDLDW